MSESRHTPARTGIQELRPGQIVAAHQHSEHQVVYAAVGLLSVTTDEATWMAPAHRAVWVPAGAVHRHRAYGTTTLLTIALPTDTNPLEVEQPVLLAVSPLLRELLRAYASCESHGARARRLRAALIGELTPAQDQALHLPVPKDPRLRAAEHRLHNALGQQCRLDQIAAEVNASPRTLTRLCRNELGMTFPQWRTQLRLHHALHMLATGQPVTMVATECGWATPSAFIDVFRAHLGYTPGRGPRIEEQTA